MKNDIFIGAGLPSIIMALYHVNKFPDREIIIIENSDTIGGSNTSIKYSNGEIFDQGMRIYYESGIDELDFFISSLLPSNDFHFLEDNYKDIAGCIFNGQVQDYSPNIDLRNLDTINKEKILGEILNSNLQIRKKSKYKNVKDYLVDKYGETVFSEGFSPILNKIYNVDCSSLSIDALRNIFGAEDRIILFSEEVTSDLMKSESLRSRFGYPNQINLPKDYSKRIGRGIYPKNIGIINFTNMLKKELLKRNIKIYFNSTVDNLNIQNGAIKSLDIKNLDNNSINNLSVSSLRWGSNLVSLSKVLGLEIKNEFDMGCETYLFNIVTNKKPLIEKVYYLMDYNLSHSIFRITNYSAYCPSSFSDGFFRLTIEVWPNGKIINPRSIITELVESKIIYDDSCIVFSDLKKLSHGFPLPTLNNNLILDQIRKGIKGLEISNLIPFCQYSKKDAFFLPQILENAYNLFQNYES